MDICPKCYGDQRFVGSFEKGVGKFVCEDCGHEGAIVTPIGKEDEGRDERD